MARLGSKLLFGTEGVDWEERINFARMREERLSRTRAALKKYKIAACLLCQPDNVRYVTGIAFPTFLPQLDYVLLGADHEPVYYQRLGRVMKGCPWIRPENFRLALTKWRGYAGGPEVTRALAKKFAADIKTSLKEMGLEKEKLGIDGFDEPAKQALREEGIELVEVMPVMLEARAVKTQDEINCLKMAAAIVDVAWQAVYECIKPGIRDREIEAVAHEALLKAGAETIGFVPVTSGAPARSTDKRVQVGDVVTIDFVGITYMGYTTCYYRSFVVGRKPTAKEKDMHKKCYERIYKVIDAIKPGATTADAAEHFAPAASYGHPSEEYLVGHDLGHGLGLSMYEYPAIERLYSFQSPQPFEEGMVLAIEAQEDDPGVGLIKLEEMVVVGKTGAEVYTRMPIEDLIITSPLLTATE
ncbi:MAG TPA: Xaa-Pro peptidase family protein [Thermodesulfobacteriota bacterium]|nr:Xaa-Pro peptidase family protein [Thermodesulfobacteriota bacterium]